MSRACSTCGSSDVDFDPSRGDTVCTNCGSVLEESAIVSEVGFQETSAGGVSVVGQFVSSEGNKVGQGLGFRPGYGRESRTVTLENGKRRLQALANQLHLNNHCLESAYRYFKLAVGKGLTKGRRSSHISAACLYLVCRMEKTPLLDLLIDFSDVIQVDVVTLGRVYLKLQHKLCIHLPVIDPCLYIHRFCHQFQLGDKENEVANTALRLVSRMKRDWIQYGRRPSGLCGAALLVASRLHGFSRTIKQVVKVVRLSNTTIRKRLRDFKQTPSGQLTVDEFNTIDLEEEQDPPCFTEARQKQKQQQIEEIEGINKPALASELEQLRNEIDARLMKTKSRCSYKSGLNSEDTDSIDGSSVCSGTNETNKLSDQTCDTLILMDNSVEKDSCDSNGEDNDNLAEIDNEKSESINEKDSEVDENVMENGEDQSIEKDGEGESEKDQNEEHQNEEDENLDDLDEDELDNFILTAPEVEIKTKIWMDENKDYLEKQKEKEEREAEEREKEEADPNRKKRRKPYKRKPKEKASSVGEAVEKMLIEKKISHKINYDVLRNLDKENELQKPSESCEPEAPSSEAVTNLLQAVQPSIPVRYTGRKRDKTFVPQLPTKRVKFMDSIPESNPVVTADAQSRSDSTVVESGPVEYDDHEVDYDHDEDEHMSVAQLMGQEYGQGDIDGYDDFGNY